jgi:hypothetical protein
VVLSIYPATQKTAYRRLYLNDISIADKAWVYVTVKETTIQEQTQSTNSEQRKLKESNTNPNQKAGENSCDSEGKAATASLVATVV